MPSRYLFLILMAFSLPVMSQSFSCGDSLLDTRDGQKYATVQVGANCWFKQNLNYGNYVASDTLGTIHSQQTNNQIPEKYAQNNDTANFAIYGGLYEQAELMNYSQGLQGLCPTGWHVSTDQEWADAISLAGGTMSSATAGNGANGLKATGTGMGGGAGTNTTGLSLLPGGDRDGFGIFYGLGLRYIFWTSTSSGPGNAYHYMFWAERDTIERFSLGVVSTGFSCRCVKDQTTGTEEGLGKTGLSVHPNPAKDVIYINNANDLEGSSFSVVDLIGRRVISGILTHHETAVDISLLPKGVYILSLDNSIHGGIKLIRE